ncbi:3-oxoacyl-ACP synthase III family protein [Actinomadura sp. 7K507]|uniref:3-oxoacyl-ACP synthase III family protein n=1 Tax=Actinomadura sp. 7K507 TaxID=2530365 RepID=UPI00104FE685|nr:3-oxoacyl-ACP synthase III family protein [Actinomadura sp. 7K507]TDC80027.1 3-oxoacyl-ACP synthase III family protein [Actinomadura sp. 7K507]
MYRSDIGIVSAGTGLPGEAIGTAALAKRFGFGAPWEHWVNTFIGTTSRHLAIDLETGEARATLADLGEEAGRKALDSAGLEPADIDLVVMGTATPDLLMPATVNQIADRLGIDGVPSFQLQSGCSGAVQAMHVASQLLSTGQYRTALVLGGDVCAKHVVPDADFSRLPPAELVNLVLFGDGAGAVVLRREPEPGAALLRGLFTRLVGLGRDPGQTLAWFGANRTFDRPAATEDYKAIEEHVPVMAVEVLKELLENLDWSEADLGYLLPPQLSGRMSTLIGQRLAVPHARQITRVHEIGNCGNGLVFFQLERALEAMGSGDRAVGVAIESSKWIKSGFALERP